MKYDLGFGNSVCVRDAFLETYHGNMIVFTNEGLSKFDYPERFGDPELVEITRKVILRQTGIVKKHVFLTNGATGAVTIGLRALHQRGFDYCITRNAPWYLRYPSMIKASGMRHQDEYFRREPKDVVVLLDVPSNPRGLTGGIDYTMTLPMVLDAVYFNNVYVSSGFIPVIAHDILCGSYSKLLGLNGLRIGWIATDDDLLAERIKDLVVGEYCGLSVASAEILKNVLYDFDWETFEDQARGYLDFNRSTWSRLEKFFGNVAVGPNGMFYYGPIDPHCRKLLEKVGISWTKGSDLGTNDSYGRFNLGQNVTTVRNVVNDIIRADTTRKSVR